jgi:hypothetical protein
VSDPRCEKCGQVGLHLCGIDLVVPLTPAMESVEALTDRASRAEAYSAEILLLRDRIKEMAAGLASPDATVAAERVREIVALERENTAMRHRVYAADGALRQVDACLESVEECAVNKCEGCHASVVLARGHIREHFNRGG